MVGVLTVMILHWWREFFFFFSSRRRHTRCSRDWSSEVCSSDLTCVGVWWSLLQLLPIFLDLRAVQPLPRLLQDLRAHQWGLARVGPDLHHPRVLREHPCSADAWQYALLPSAAQAVSPLSGVPRATPSLSERSWHSRTVCAPRIYALPFSATRYTLPMSVVSCTPS